MLDKVIEDCYNVIIDYKKGGSTVDDLIKAIKKAEQVVKALTQLALEIGTLIAIIKMISESI